jgi:hypothetical protein
MTQITDVSVGHLDNLGAEDLGQPLLTVEGWNFYHAGIQWTKVLPHENYAIQPHQTRAVLLLAIQAVHPTKIAGELSAHKIPFDDAY